MRRTLRRTLVALIATATLIAPVSTAWAQPGQTGASLVQRLIAAVDESLGDDATVAVLRAYDRGYDVFQILEEGVFEGGLAPDGTVTDEDGVAVAPSGTPSGLIAENGSATSSGPVGGRVRSFGPMSGEEIGLDALERGVKKTTKRLDKKNDLGARADDYDTSLDIFMMLTVIVLMNKGYSPEQIIIDGHIENGIDLMSFTIRDAEGKVLRPDGVEPQAEDPETNPTYEKLFDDVSDAVLGEDPLAAADDRFKRQYTLTTEVDFSGDGGTGSIEGKANIGARKGEEGALSGRGTGTFTAKGACSVGEDGSGLFDTTQYPYALSGPLRIGIAGRVSKGNATLNIGVAATSSVQVDAEGDAFCLEIVRDTADITLQVISIPDVTVRLRDGATANADNQDTGHPFTVGVAVRVKKI